MRSSGARPHARAALPALQWGVPYAPGCPYSRKYRHPDAHIYVNMGTPGCPYLRGVYIFMTPVAIMHATGVTVYFRATHYSMASKLSVYWHRRRKLLKAGGAQEVVINFELFAVNVGVADT